MKPLEAYCLNEIEDLDLLEYKELLKIKRPEIDSCHKDPSIYNISQEEVDKMRLYFLKNQKKEAENKLKDVHAKYLLDPSLINEWLFNHESKEYDKASRAVDYFKNKDNIKQIDIQSLKVIPINRVVHIEQNGFFKIREEKTASCYWYKKSNRWYDFGASEGGDVIDLIMKIDNCDFKTACNRLSNLL